MNCVMRNQEEREAEEDEKNLQRLTNAVLRFEEMGKRAKPWCEKQLLEEQKLRSKK